MSNIDLAAIIQQHFPKAIDCIDGHLGPETTSIEQELDDDRYYDIKVTRCGHCGIPLQEDYV